MAVLDLATTLLTSTSDHLREVYHPDVIDQFSRFGKAENRLFRFSKRKINGDGINIQTTLGNMYGARWGTGINGGFPTPRSYEADKYKVTLSETDASNDFRRMSLSLSITDLDLTRTPDTEAAAVDFKKKLLKQATDNMQESLALHRQLDRTALVATINGTPAKADNRLFASCSAIGTSGGIRVPIDGGSIASLPRGLELDTYTGSTKDYTVVVQDYNPRDNSIAFYATSGTPPVPSSTIDMGAAGSNGAVADNDDLYISGEKGKGMISVGEWFKDPASTGDSHFGKDRYALENYWMRPHKSGPTTDTPFDPQYIDDCAIQMGYIQEDVDGAYIALTTPELEQAYRNAVGQDVFIQFPTDDQKGKILAQYGFDGNIYRHPALGRIMLQTSPFAPQNKIRLMRPGDWETCTASDTPFRWMPGLIDMWYRVQADTPGEGLSTVWRADGYMLAADICLNPRAQAEIEHVTG